MFYARASRKQTARHQTASCSYGRGTHPGASIRRKGTGRPGTSEKWMGWRSCEHGASDYIRRQGGVCRHPRARRQGHHELIRENHHASLAYSSLDVPVCASSRTPPASIKIRFHSGASRCTGCCFPPSNVPREGEKPPSRRCEVSLAVRHLPGVAKSFS